MDEKHLNLFSVFSERNHPFLIEYSVSITLYKAMIRSKAECAHVYEKQQKHSLICVIVRVIEVVVNAHE